MNMIKKIGTSLLMGLALVACKKDEVPSVDDYPLNYDIPQVTVKEDIPVGAYVYNPATMLSDEIRWTRITEGYDESAGKIGPYVTPELGRYTLNATEEGAAGLTKIVEWAKLGRIDFLITPALKEHANALYPNNLNGGDSLIVNMFAEHNTNLPSVNMDDLKYAISVDINNFSAGLSNNTLLEYAPLHVLNINGRDTALTRENRLYSFMKRIAHYFSDETYYHFNGRPVVVLIGADRLYSEDTKKVYDNIRNIMKEQSGKDVYLIARQPQWSPSARYEYFFMRGQVDAVTMDNMCNVGGGQWDRTYLLSQLIDQNFKINKTYMQDHFGIDFIPSASPSFTQYLSGTGSPDYNYPTIHKDEAGFRERCNVAKLNLGTNGMVLIESFNNWIYDSQIEPTVADYGKGYGTKYLDIVREEFKIQ